MCLVYPSLFPGTRPAILCGKHTSAMSLSAVKCSLWPPSNTEEITDHFLLKKILFLRMCPFLDQINKSKERIMPVHVRMEKYEKNVRQKMEKYIWYVLIQVGICLNE